MTKTMSQAPSMATFAKLVKSSFRLRLEPETSIEVELTEFKQMAATAGYEQFSLVFQGPADAPMGQSIYELEQEGTGTFEIFLVPVAVNEIGVLYEAAFVKRSESSAGGN